MSTRRAIRSTRTNRCGAPATRRSPASAVRTPARRSSECIPYRADSCPDRAAVGALCIPRGQAEADGSRQGVQPEDGAGTPRHQASGCRSVEASKRRASDCRDTGASLEDAKVRLSGQFICISREYELLLPGIGRPSAPPTDNPLRYASAPARSHPNPIVQPNENDTSAVRLPAGTRPEESAHGQKRPPHSFRLAVKRMPRFRAETATQ